MAYQYPPPPPNGADMDMAPSGYLPSYSVAPHASSGMDPDSSIPRERSELRRSISTPVVGPPQGHPQQSPQQAGASGQDAAAERRRNKLGYHRTSVACVPRGGVRAANDPVASSTRAYEYGQHGMSSWMPADASPNSSKPNDMNATWRSYPGDSPVTPAFSPYTPHAPSSVAWSASVGSDSSSRDDITWSSYPAPPPRSMSFGAESMSGHTHYPSMSQPNHHSSRGLRTTIELLFVATVVLVLEARRRLWQRVSCVVESCCLQDASVVNGPAPPFTRLRTGGVTWSYNRSFDAVASMRET
ncbi:hypothetical protein CHGG_00940 [Chaetomium globosum CBS 148.51]|uniref:Uncharacterized protein n=1 Tax=Chaetomium globosum (strain ATCC 6205 / CBS 148.51 / DSM 1962 / NBRC 6347 / NRRL 1970) TaxID=306901 RepID=Q2HFR4_CHAGB|nr:uncharacterized protein CHGG_00940 [Chaetomium globosum CBS 148.51]EAQ92705.1 hypothetical protein CHGG_00940 [Chaetomium globosum CBS 148.51]